MRRPSSDRGRTCGACSCLSPMFVHVKRTQATLGLSVVFATVAMVRTDRALPCNLFDRRRVLQYAAQVLQHAAFSAAVRARTPGPSAWCCSTLHQVLRYAASGAAVRFDQVQSDASSAAVRARTLVRRCITPLACRGTLLSVDAVSSAAVRARTLGSALQHAALVLRYAASSAAVCRDHTPQYASGPSARRCSALYQVPQCVPQCAASGAVVRCDR